MKFVSHPTIALDKTERDIIEKAILLFDDIASQALYAGAAFDEISDDAANISGYLSNFYDCCVEENDWQNRNFLL